MSLISRRVSAVVLMLRAAREWAGARRDGGSGAPTGGGLFSPVRGVAAVAVALAALAVGAAPAQASFHAFSSSFGSQGSAAGQVSSPQSVAVNDATGDVYVADTGNARVDEFDASGNFVRAWGWGVADGNPSFETCTTTCQAGIGGNGVGQFSSPTFVAVDNSGGASAGDVYVGDTGDNLVQKFDANGNPVATWGDGGAGTCGTANGQLSGGCATGGPFGGLAGVTVDTGGNLWVYDTNSNMFEFAHDGSFTTGWNSGRGVDANGIGVDRDGDLYVVVGAGNVEQFSPSGTDIGDVSDDAGAITGFAVDATTNDVYADDGSEIHHYLGSSLSSCVAAGTCAAADTFGSGERNGAAGLGVLPSASGGAVYAADAGNQRIDVFTPPAGPIVDGESFTGVDTTSATLQAQVNPIGLDTTYHFEYGSAGPCASNPCQSVPVPDADIGQGTADAAVSQNVQALQPATIYHFRVVATNSLGTTDGPDQTFTTYQTTPAQSCPNAQFRTGDSANLPDCRAYESVTPADIPDGAVIDQAYGWPDGQHVYYTATTALSPSAPNGGIQSELATRTQGGWVTTAILPPEGPGTPVGTASSLTDPVAFTSDFSAAFINNPFDDDPLDQDNGAMDTYRFDLATGGVSLASRPDTGPMTAAMAGGKNNSISPPGAYLDGVSADGSAVFFETNGQLPVAPGTTPDTRTPGPAAGDEIYERAGGHTYLVGILPDGSVPACGAGIANGTVNSFATNPFFSYQAVAPDGSNVVFNASDCSSSGMYLRDLVHGTTVPLPGTGYAGRTADGTKIFIASDQSNGDLAEYDVATRQLTEIGAGQLLASSDDGSRVYYLGPGNALYLWDHGTTTMIPGTGAGGYETGAVAAALAQNVPDATPDGSSLEFIDSDRLTAYDNQGHKEAYLYRAGTNSVICVSCNPSGAPPDRNSNPSVGQNDAQLLDLQRHPPDPLLPQTMRLVSSDGERAVFETTDTLLPQDHNPPQASYDGGNGSAPGMDVYEWEADGTGSCQSASVNGGCLYLLSAGRAGLSSYLAGASADLTDVYIDTADQLLPGMDGAFHIYDVRIDGGFPALSGPAPCLGDACQGAVTAPVSPPAIATISFAGPGNASASAPPGRVRVINKTVRGSRFVLTVRVPAAGQIVITGVDVKTVRKAVGRAGSYRITVALTAHAKRALAHKHKLTVVVHVRYAPVGGVASTATVTVRLSERVRGRR